MTTNKTFMDKMAEKADELELQRKAEDLVDAVSKFAQAAVGKAGEYAHENLDKVEGILDKAAAKVDEQTDGKYADKVAKAREAASKGVSKLAEQRAAAASAATEATQEASDTAEQTWAQATDDTSVGHDPSI